MREAGKAMKPVFGAAKEKWTMAEKEQLSLLWDEGLSITKIGIEMGISRNAVAGKAHRMGLPGRGSPKQLASGPKRGRKPKPLRKPTCFERASAHNGPGISLADRTPRECGWIVGEPRDFRCCGAPTMPGTDWCEFHARKVYRQSGDIPRGLRLPGEKKRRAA